MPGPEPTPRHGFDVAPPLDTAETRRAATTTTGGTMTIKHELTALDDLARNAIRDYSGGAEEDDQELADAVRTADAALQIVCTLITIRNEQQAIARARTEADRHTNLHSEMRDLLNEQRQRLAGEIL
ncbi:RNA binding protein [Mycobacterium phage ThulaThula]|uniref:RNA binding protein n=1 Tax=Mycobacterium phage ThulaThula TaxID=2599880 RepID=A0A5J6TE25_9CAUD|nr:RNA binding protein [Mycobacterium phage ThulaThula]QFG09091.1 RNA binding protein [Mycobacterium phage ThulaThula]